MTPQPLFRIILSTDPATDDGEILVDISIADPVPDITPDDIAAALAVVILNGLREKIAAAYAAHAAMESAAANVN